MFMILWPTASWCFMYPIPCSLQRKVNGQLGAKRFLPLGGASASTDSSGHGNSIRFKLMAVHGVQQPARAESQPRIIDLTWHWRCLSGYSVHVLCIYIYTYIYIYYGGCVQYALVCLCKFERTGDQQKAQHVVQCCRRPALFLHPLLPYIPNSPLYFLCPRYAQLKFEMDMWIVMDYIGLHWTWGQGVRDES